METKIKPSKNLEGITQERWHQIGHAHCSFLQVRLKTTKATAALKSEPEEQRSGWGHACLHWRSSLLCICNTISTKLSSFISRVCSNYDSIELHNVLSNYRLYLFVYLYIHIYTYIFSNSWHWCTQTKSEAERRMLDEGTRTQRGSTPIYWWSSNGQNSEPAHTPTMLQTKLGSWMGWTTLRGTCGCQQPFLQPFLASGPLSIPLQQLRPC